MNLPELANYRKAIVAFFAPGIVILGAPLSQGHAPEASDWWTALGAVVLAAVAVYVTPNRSLPQADEWTHLDDEPV